MKTVWGMVLLSAWISSGCLTLPPRWTEPKTPPVAPTSATATQARPPVTRDQVNKENARELADALLEELDQEAQPPAPVKPEKP
jgi:hypothetical protein